MIDSEHHSVRLHGFSLYASPSVAACATAFRERLARYIARPPIAESRLSVMADGYILLRLKRSFRNGIHSVRQHPFAFIERLSAVVAGTLSSVALHRRTRMHENRKSPSESRPEHERWRQCGRGPGAHGLPARICTAAVLLLLPALHWSGVLLAFGMQNVSIGDIGRADLMWGPIWDLAVPHIVAILALQLFALACGASPVKSALASMLPVLTIATLSALACAIGTIDERHFYQVGPPAIAIVAITVLAGGWYLGFRVVGRQAESFRSRPWRFVGLAASALLALGFSSAIALAVFAILFSG